MHARRPGRRASPPDDFRQYLLDGDHYRVGRYLAARERAARYNHLQTNSREGQLLPVFIEHLDQALTEERAKATIDRARWRHASVEEALGELELEYPEAVAALRHYLVPLGMRRRNAANAVAVADGLGLTYDELYEAGQAGVRLVWEWLGGVW